MPIPRPGTRRARLTTTALLLALPALLPAQGAAPGGAGALERARWLAGCWEGVSGARAVEERWAPPRGGTMLGTGRAFRGDSTTSVELVLLRARGDTLRYEAHPVGQAPAVFVAVAAAGDELRFENPAHDFPQRIRYRPVGADSLLASVEGPLRGEWRVVEYRMRRAPCEAPPAAPARP